MAQDKIEVFVHVALCYHPSVRWLRKRLISFYAIAQKEDKSTIRGLIMALSPECVKNAQVRIDCLRDDYEKGRSNAQ